MGLKRQIRWPANIVCYNETWTKLVLWADDTFRRKFFIAGICVLIQILVQLVTNQQRFNDKWFWWYMWQLSAKSFSNKITNMLFFDKRITYLRHWDLNKMANILQTTFWNTISWMKMFVFWFKYHQNCSQGSDQSEITICFDNGLAPLAPYLNQWSLLENIYTFRGCFFNIKMPSYQHENTYYEDKDGLTTILSI